MKAIKHHFSRRRCKREAFSLVEVTMALGIMAFALVSIIGLVPSGLSTFRQTVNISVGSQIVQQVVADLQQSGTLPEQPEWRYFNDQGQEYTSAADRGTGNNEPVIYYVNVMVDPQVTLPGGDSSSLARAVIEIVNNPGNIQLSRDAEGSVVGSRNLPVSRYSAFVSKNR
ncbi:MAG: Verru_Chthon cassette protein B [Verrucomicrobiales bacterium]|jgi:uncharacterized protein (TIGR02598 family)|nr:Verru_Chthon cassette protein B [Verrucomicrobiales bacterium]